VVDLGGDVFVASGDYAKVDLEYSCYSGVVAFVYQLQVFSLGWVDVDVLNLWY
jgi:hypothetical protein